MPELVADIAVIGAGPAGYSAAVRASKLGARVTLVEKGKLGGACLNWACIPTKTLLHSLELLRTIKNSGIHGIDCGPVSIDVGKLVARKDAVISIMTGGVAQLLAEHGIDVVAGEACFSSDNSLVIRKQDGVSLHLHSAKIIIATGSVPCRLNIPGAEDAEIMYSRDIIELKRIPQSLILVGGGVVGVELATILNGLGCKITLIEIMPRILPCEDTEVTQILERALKQDGIRIYTNARIDRIETLQGAKRGHFMCGDRENILEAEAVAVAIGQKPYLGGLSLEECGITSGARGIEVDKHMRTSIPGIFAAGDVAGKSMLAYVAMAEGRVAAENAMGIKSEMDYSVVPRCVFTTPEIASVGLTEADALSRGLKIRCLRSNVAANAAATILGKRRGLAKLIVAEDSGVLLGTHIVGAGAAELIAECALAIRLHATAGDLVRTLHPHPSLSETIWDAVLSSQD